MRHLAETGVSAMWCGQERLLLGTFPHILILYVVYHTDFLFAYVLILFLRCGTTRATASTFTKFLDHTQRRITFGRTPLDG